MAGKHRTGDSRFEVKLPVVTTCYMLGLTCEMDVTGRCICIILWYRLRTRHRGLRSSFRSYNAPTTQIDKQTDTHKGTHTHTHTCTSTDIRTLQKAGAGNTNYIGNAERRTRPTCDNRLHRRNIIDIQRALQTFQTLVRPRLMAPSVANKSVGVTTCAPRPSRLTP